MGRPLESNFSASLLGNIVHYCAHLSASQHFMCTKIKLHFFAKHFSALTIFLSEQNYVNKEMRRSGSLSS